MTTPTIDADAVPVDGPRDLDLRHDQLPNVHQAIADAMRRIRAVGKEGRNARDGYAFKRIDDFMTAAHEALSQAGVHIVPKVLQRITDETHLTGSGNVMRWVDLEVQFRFYGPRGDSVKVVTWGEGRDASDKATNKALTGAMKYALMYALMVPTDDIQDADRSSPESGSREQEHSLPNPRLAAAEARARAIATDTATPEVVARLRTDVLGYADTITQPVARREHLLATWREAEREGALGCTVLVPEPWQQLAGRTEATLHELIEGAVNPGLPPTGETQVEQQELPDDPWATPGGTVAGEAKP